MNQGQPLSGWPSLSICRLRAEVITQAADHAGAIDLVAKLHVAPGEAREARAGDLRYNAETSLAERAGWAHVELVGKAALLREGRAPVASHLMPDAQRAERLQHKVVRRLERGAEPRPGMDQRARQGVVGDRTRDDALALLAHIRRQLAEISLSEVDAGRRRQEPVVRQGDVVCPRRRQVEAVAVER